MSTRFTRILRTSALLVTAGLVLATPAFAHKGDSGKSAKSAKPVLDLAAATVTPNAAATTAISAAGGGELVEMKLEQHKKKGARLQVEVRTATGITEVKIDPATGAVLGSHAHRNNGHAAMSLPPVGVTWATYGAAVPAGSLGVSKISLEHSTSKNLDVVKVEFYKSTGKKGKLRLSLDGAVI